MPTVATEVQFRFVVNTRENEFEPPHVHVWVGNEDVCRVSSTASGSWTSRRPATTAVSSTDTEDMQTQSERPGTTFTGDR